MTIYFGADHRGFALKEKLKKMLADEAYDVVDLGAAAYDQGDDYPDFAKAAGEELVKAPDGSRGILICGSGIGIDIAANKMPGVRAALATLPDQAYAARHDDDVNALVLAADFTDEATAQRIVKTFLSTPFAGEERYRRRLEKLSQLDAS